MRLGARFSSKASRYQIAMTATNTWEMVMTVMVVMRVWDEGWVAVAHTEGFRLPDRDGRDKDFGRLGGCGLDSTDSKTYSVASGVCVAYLGVRVCAVCECGWVLCASGGCGV